MSSEIRHLYEFDAFRLDPAERQLLHGGQPVPLTAKVFETLVVLVARSGHLVEKEELMNLVWGEVFVEEANLARCVHTLRKALGEEHNGHKYIETVPKRGYRFVAAVREIENGDAGATPDKLGVETPGRRHAAQDVEPETPPDDEAGANASTTASPLRLSPTLALAWPRRRAAASVFIVPLALVVVAAAVGAYFYVNHSRQVPTNNPPISSIAVLPFVNVGADPNLDYLSDGLSESLIDRLSQLPLLKVIARSSSFKYRGESIDVQDVAKKLGVQALVMGRVVRSGDNLAVRVEMVDVRENRQLWSEQYNRRAADALSVQEELAHTVAEKLRLRLSGAQAQQLAKRETANPQAYELLLKGRFYRLKGGTEDGKKAVEYLQQAIAVDPAYAHAYAALSNSYSDLTNASVLDPKEFRPKAEAAARKALELDERLAEAHDALASLKLNAWDWAAAEQAYQRAIELNPNLANAHLGYAFYLSLVGRHEQADAEIKRARDLNPLSPFVNANVGYSLLLARRYDQAVETLKRTLELEPNNPFTTGLLAHTYMGKGMYAEAIAAFQRTIELGGDEPGGRIYLGTAYAKAGERGRAQAILKRLETSGSYVSPGELAVLYAALGEREQAFASLERAYAARDSQLQFLRVEPAFDPLRSDRRFQDLLRHVGLPQ
jgi:TolB-like protein/DNA-binding winged helix-turn-helix (wHTH) protein/Tfp pilus assembly protein PilF